jgi:hypothetical protein
MSMKIARRVLRTSESCEGDQQGVQEDVQVIKEHMQGMRGETGESTGLMKGMLQELTTMHEDARYLCNPVNMLVRSDAEYEVAIESFQIAIVIKRHEALHA